MNLNSARLGRRFAAAFGFAAPPPAGASGGAPPGVPAVSPAIAIDGNLALRPVPPMTDPGEVVLVQITFDDEEHTVRLAAFLVEERLVAGARVLPRHTALSLPDGGPQATSGVLLTALTTVGRFAALSDRVRGRPGVQPPGVLAIPVPLMNHGVFEWVRASTLPEPGPEPPPGAPASALQ